MLTEQILKELEGSNIPKQNILLDEPMKNHTSFKIGGPAKIFLTVESTEQLKKVLKIVRKYNVLSYVLGNGSNVLVNDEGINGIVIKLDFKDIKIRRQETNAYVEVGAGVSLGALAQRLKTEEISGFEFAAGIPGTIGGAVRMNAGAYGCEFKDIVEKTMCLDENENLKILSNLEQKFTYRNSVFEYKKYIIVETVLKLNYGNKEDIESKMNTFRISRMEKQPLEYPSAGSTFKRGNNFITAKLIDECNLKGYRIGGAEVSQKHAGFIVNTGNATAQDVIDLVNYVEKTVLEQTGEKIELEIEII